MIVFSDDAVVNIPGHMLLPGNCRVSVRIDGDSDIPLINDHFGSRLLNFELIDTVFGADSFPAGLNGARVRIIIAGKDISFIGEHIDSIGATQPFFHIVPDDNLIGTVNFITSFKFPVHIDTSQPPSSEDTLLQSLDFYLHNPLLTVPVEPFHTLLMTSSRGKGFTLWDTEMERLPINYYIDKKGNISLSKRWGSQSKTFGSVSDRWDTIAQSAFMVDMRSFKQSLFQDRAVCSYCQHFDLCEGFLKAVDSSWNCDSWKQVFSVLKSESKKAKEILESDGNN